jgi:hypothetical protein
VRAPKLMELVRAKPYNYSLWFISYQFMLQLMVIFGV